jgi:hypothetical protein
MRIVGLLGNGPNSVVVRQVNVWEHGLSEPDFIVRSYRPIKEERKPGATVEHSGVYAVRQGPEHTVPAHRQYGLQHPAIRLVGPEFPSCRNCGELPCSVMTGNGESSEQNGNFE